MQDWAKLKVVDLKAELKRRELNPNGLKAELVQRLQEDDSAKENNAAGQEEEESKADAATTTNEVADTTQNDVNEAAPAVEATPPAVDNVDVAVTATKPEASLATKNEASPEKMEIDEISAVNLRSQSQESVPSPIVQTPVPRSAAGPPANLPSPESHKRKRRSQSPPPVEDDVARKRARADSDAGPRNGVVVDPETEIMPDAPPPPSPREGRPLADPSQTLSPNRRDETGFERDVVPALHPATSALYINNLMRPLRPADLRSHLASFASPNASADEVITTFFLDQIRTHAFVVFDSTTSASRVRTALHDRVWPEESNRKPLSVDFVPPEKVEEWIKTEEGTGRAARSGSRWEIVYDTLPNGTVEVYLESGAVSTARPGPPPPARGGSLSGPNPRNGPNSIPLGPRGFRDDMKPPPTGPRSSRDQFRREAPLPPPGSRTTRAHPIISYQPVSSAIAQRRLDNMQSHYTRDTRRLLGREINRYYFEDGDKFVDRGKEVFEGIRPPHRDRGAGPRGRGGGRRRGGGGGGGGGRGRGGDRYMPPPRGRLVEDDGRLPRYDDN